MGPLLSNVNIGIHLWVVLDFPGGLDNKESTCNAGTEGDADSIPGPEDPLEQGHGNPLHYSFLFFYFFKNYFYFYFFYYYFFNL